VDLKDQGLYMNFRSSELTSGKLFPFHRPSTVMGLPEWCSQARIRFAALTRVLACSAPFRRISTCDGRLRREHLSDSDSHQWSTRKNVDSAGLLMEVADNTGIGGLTGRGTESTPVGIQSVP
jgi:hypothetical protein